MALRKLEISRDIMPFDLLRKLFAQKKIPAWSKLQRHEHLSRPYQVLVKVLAQRSIKSFFPELCHHVRSSARSYELLQWDTLSRWSWSMYPIRSIWLTATRWPQQAPRERIHQIYWEGWEDSVTPSGSAWTGTLQLVSTVKYYTKKYETLIICKNQQSMGFA